jgi:hypothetical protein
MRKKLLLLAALTLATAASLTAPQAQAALLGRRRPLPRLSDVHHLPGRHAVLHHLSVQR